MTESSTQAAPGDPVVLTTGSVEGVLAAISDGAGPVAAPSDAVAARTSAAAATAALRSTLNMGGLGKINAFFEKKSTKDPICCQLQFVLCGIAER